MRRRVVALAVVTALAVFTAYGGPLRPAPVHWLSDRIDVPVLRD